MKVTVNSRQEEIHLGCRSYLYLDQLLRLLVLADAKEVQVTVNGQQIEKDNFSSAEVKSADKVRITVCRAGIINSKQEMS